MHQWRNCGGGGAGGRTASQWRVHNQKSNGGPMGGGVMPIDSERENMLPPHGLLFPISSKGSFICIIPQTGWHIPRPLLPVVEHWLEREIAQWVHSMKDRSERTLLQWSYTSLFMGYSVRLSVYRLTLSLIWVIDNCDYFKLSVNWYVSVL